MKPSHQFLVFGCFAMVVLGIPLTAHTFNNNERSFSITLPPDPISFQSGPGSQIATTYCLICHSAEYVYTQPLHSREKWEEIVKKMKHTFGCPIPQSDIPTLVTYLFSQNEIQPSAKRETMKERMNAPPSQSGKPSSGHEAKGKRVFKTYCVNCHGLSGKGDGPIGQALVPPAADLTVIGKKSDKEILKTIRNGRPGTAMPSWKGDLSGQDMEDLVSYIRTLSQ